MILLRIITGLLVLASLGVLVLVLAIALSMVTP